MKVTVAPFGTQTKALLVETSSPDTVAEASGFDPHATPASAGTGSPGKAPTAGAATPSKPANIKTATNEKPKRRATKATRTTFRRDGNLPIQTTGTQTVGKTQKNYSHRRTNLGMPRCSWLNLGLAEAQEAEFA